LFINLLKIQKNGKVVKFHTVVNIKTRSGSEVLQNLAKKNFLSEYK